jgi:pimeloyl-ACP methyl ester carboxylesterase
MDIDEAHLVHYVVAVAGVPAPQGRRRMIGSTVRALMAGCCALTLAAGAVAAAPEPSARVFYRSVKVDGLSIFYREAGPPEAPTLLLLHGFPSSSRMYEPLFARLAGRFHLIAPDYPGFGHSDAPDTRTFAYTFDAIAAVIGRFTESVGAMRYTLYLQDYGAPVGFRLALAHPERVRGLIIQNAVAHEDGLGPAWEARRQFWRDRAAHEAAFQKAFLSFETTQKRHIGASPNAANYDPDLWTDEFAFLSRPGETAIQTDLFYDYRTNEPSFPAWQAWMRRAQPPALVVWGRYDPSFETAEAAAYRRELPHAEIHVLDAGHFALDEKADAIADYISTFFAQPASR